MPAFYVPSCTRRMVYDSCSKLYSSDSVIQSSPIYNTKKLTENFLFWRSSCAVPALTCLVDELPMLPVLPVPAMPLAVPLRAGTATEPFLDH